MRRSALVIPLLALLGTSLAGCAALPSGLPASAKSPLQLASPQLSQWSYRLASLPSCQVGDGIAVLKNDAVDPIRITRVGMITSGGGAALGRTHWAFQLMTFRRGSTTGELAGSFALTVLGNGRPSGAAIGGVLNPVVKSGRWYDVVARVQLPVGHTSPWSIHGIVISYERGPHLYTSRFRQSIRMPATSRCKRA
jgi:hypothetical protein